MQRAVARRQVMRCRGGLWHRTVMPRPRKIHPPTVADELEALLGFRWAMGRPPKQDLANWAIIDDWLDPAPVTLAEVDVFERYFGDLFDELFGLGD